MRQVQRLSSIWLRPLIILGGLLLVAMLAFKASQSQLRLVPFVPLGVGMLLAFLRWPSLGIIFAAVAGLIIPYTGPSGLNVTMILLALMLVLWLMDMIVRQGQVRIASSRTVWPLIAFLIAGIVSFGMGQLPWLTFALHAPLGAQLGGLAVMVLSAGALLLVGNQVQDLRSLQALTWVILAVSAMSLLARSVLPLLGLPTMRFFQSTGTVFYICLVSIAFSQAVLNVDLHRGWRLLLGGLVLIALYVLFFLKFDDKSGWLSAFICIGAIIGARFRRLGVVLVPVAALTVVLLWSRIVGTDEYSISTRLDAWIIMGQIIKISPIVGLGFANYYWYTPLFPIRGYAVSFNSHNNYVDILAEMGLVGLVCLLVVFWQVGWLGWRLRKLAPPGFAQAYVYGALGVLVGMVAAGMFGDWVLPFFYNIGLHGLRSSLLGWILLGGLLSLEQIYKTSMQTVPSGEVGALPERSGTDIGPLEQTVKPSQGKQS